MKQQKYRVKTKFKREEGITLIALVITIIVLLILAGVTIATLTGENGILTKATEAQKNTGISTEKEEIAVAYNGARIEKQEDITVTADDMNKQFEKNNTNAEASGTIKVYFPDSERWYAVDSSGKITGPYTNEGEIEESSVNIIVSKNPESEPSSGVILKVEKVEGIEIDLNDIDISQLSEDLKKEFFKAMDLYSYSLIGKNYKNFDELLEDFCDGDEQLYWDRLLYQAGNMDNALKVYIDKFKEDKISTIPCYSITNPDGEIANQYVALKNDIYTFIIENIVTGEKYEKTVQVTNIDDNTQSYYVKVAGNIYLCDINNKTADFENAYIFYEGERIDVTSCIAESNDVVKSVDVGFLLENMEKVSDLNDINGSLQTFEIVKDGKSYFGRGEINWPW